MNPYREMRVKHEEDKYDIARQIGVHYAKLRSYAIIVAEAPARFIYYPGDAMCSNEVESENYKLVWLQGCDTPLLVLK